MIQFWLFFLIIKEVKINIYFIFSVNRTKKIIIRIGVMKLKKWKIERIGHETGLIFKSESNRLINKLRDSNSMVIKV